MGLLLTAFLVALTAILAPLVPQFTFMQPNKPLHVSGFVEHGFEPIEEAFKQNFKDGWEREGATFAAYYKGRLVANLWGGYADSGANRLWQENTISLAMSSTKAVTGLCLAMLVDRGLLDYDALVTKYWPEFGKNGKANVTVKMILAHQAGLAALDNDVTVEDAADWRKMSKHFEDQVPNWPPGTAAGYHGITYGWLADGILRRVDPEKRSLGKFFADEIAKPHGIDFYIGLPYNQFYRYARSKAAVLGQSLERLGERSMFQAFFNFILEQQRNPLLKKVMGTPTWLVNFDGTTMPTNNPDILRLEIPAAGGIGTAKALANIFNVALEGKLFTNITTLEKLAVPYHFESATPSKFFHGILNRAGFGFLHQKTENKHEIFGHEGYGGQSVKIDLNNKLAIAYLTNGFGPDYGLNHRRYLRLEKALYKSIASVTK